MTQATISRVETGDRWPQRSTVDRLLAAMAEAQPAGALTIHTPEAAEGAGGQLTELAMADMLGTTPDPVRWVVDEVAARGAVTMLAGRYGQGKSLLAQSLAVAVAEGHGRVASFRVRAGRALILDAENGANLIHTRLVNLGLTAAGAAHMRVITARSFDVQRDHARLVRTLEAGETPDLLVLDTWTSLWAGSESSVEQVQTCLNGLRDLAVAFDLAVVLLHHTTKAGETFRGSSAIAATIEAVFMLGRPDVASDDRERVLTCEKMRIAPEPPPFAFRVGYPLT